MRDSKLITLLRTFTKSEIKEFEKFVESPYFGRGRDLTSLFRAVKRFYPEFSSQDFTIEKIFKIIYPGREFGDAKSNSLMKTLISELYKMCIDFLAFSSLKEDESRRSYYILCQLRKRKHYIEFDKVYEKITKQKDNSNRGGIDDFIDKYFISTEFKNYSLDRDDFASSFEYTMASDENIVAAALMMTFMIEDVKNITTGYNLPMRYTLMDNLLGNLNAENLIEEMKKNNDRFYPYVVIFYMIYKMNKFRDKREYYYELKRLLMEYKSLFGNGENYVLWNIVLTYGSVNKFAIEEDILIYDYMLENNIYKKSESDDFHIILYRNIVTRYALAGRNKQLELFIEKYSQELHQDHRENMYNFSHAHLNFAKGNFEKALELTGRINNDVFVFKFDVRLLMLKIYYELSYYEQMYSLVDSTLHFLRDTNEFSEMEKIYSSEIIKNFYTLLKLKTSGKPDCNDLTFFEKKTLEAPPTGQTKWLLEKIEQIKKSM